MTILMDSEIDALSRLDDRPMITPFVDHAVRTDEKGEGVISYGLSSAGYDVRLSNSFKVARPCLSIENDPIDPKKANEDHFHYAVTSEPLILDAHGFVIGHTEEVFDIPNDVMVVCVGKSTYARAGVIINVTPIEPGFSGQVVIEIANQSHRPVKIYPGEGIAQFLFFRGSRRASITYADKNGKYQHQRGITHAKV